MQHRSHIDEHGLIIVRNRASDNALRHNDTMAQNKIVQLALQIVLEAVSKLLLNSLWLSQVNLFNLNCILVQLVLQNHL